MSRLLSVGLGCLLVMGVAATSLTPARAAAPDEPRVQVALALTGGPSPAFRFARAHNLRVDQVTAHAVVLSGPAQQTAASFGARLHAVPGRSDRRGAPARYLAATTPPAVPASLHGAVSAVIGLDTRPLFHRRTVPTGYIGADLTAAYDAAGLSGAGAGITVATVQFDGWNPSDATTYAAAAGIALGANQITTIPVSGASTAPDGSGGDQEVALDVEGLLATAPRAAQRVYVSPNTSAGAYAVYDQIATDVAAGVVQVVSTSWGGCEADMGAAEITKLNGPVSRVVANGATLFAASGDSGAYDCATPLVPDGRLSVDFPASSPVVVGVGGTTLTRSGTSYAETAWGPSPTTTAALIYPGPGSGGGASTSFGRPSYQSALTGPGRLVPDVSSLGDPSTGLGVYISSAGGWRKVGGTSLGAPLWAGQLASALSTAGRTRGIGDIHAALYAHPSALRDVVSGANGFYTAAGGFDEVTGLGSPQWSTLYPALGLNAAPATTPSFLATRLAGADRYATAASIATAAFPTAANVLVASGENFPDALAGNYLAGSQAGPVLLTQAGSLPLATRNALATLQATHVTILGGTGAVSQAVQDTLAAAGYTVTRIGGSDRYATAQLISQAPGAGNVGSDAGLRTAILASGQSFADALTAGPLGYAKAFPVEITTPGSLSPATQQAFAKLGIQHVLIAGGTAAVSQAVENQLNALGITTARLAGATRQLTAVALADYESAHGFSVARISLARGDAFADALSGGPYAGRQPAPILLTDSPTALGRAASDALSAHASTLVSGTIFGGTAAVSDAVKAAAQAAAQAAATPA